MIAAFSSDPGNKIDENILAYAVAVQHGFVLYFLAAAAVSYLLGSILLCLLKRAERNLSPSMKWIYNTQFLKQLHWLFLWHSVFLAFLGAIVTSVVTSALVFQFKSVENFPLVVTAGALLQTLQWIAALLTLTLAGGVTLIFMARGPMQRSAAGVLSSGLGPSSDFAGAGLGPSSSFTDAGVGPSRGSTGAQLDPNGAIEIGGQGGAAGGNDAPPKYI